MNITGLENTSNKVVIIGSAHPLRGGLATFNERLAKEYSQQGWEVTMFSFSLQYPSLLFPGKSQFTDEPAPEGLKIRTLVNSVNPLNWIRVGRMIKKMRPDLVVVKFWIPFMAPCLGTIARISRRNGCSRVVSIVDNVIPHEKRPGDRILARYFVNSVDGFIAMSQSVLGDLWSLDTRKPKLFCAHPLYDNFGEAVSRGRALEILRLDPSFRYLLFFGFIRDYKGLDLLLEAFAMPDIQELPLKLIVAGEFYSDPKPYLDQINRLGINERLVLANDFIPDSEVVNYFCACDLVVQPYKSATQSGVTQIAYHFNKPMVVTNVGGLAEIVPHGKAGYVVKPEPEAVAMAILDFFQYGREAEYSRNASLEKTKYSWGNMVNTIRKITAST